MKLAIHPLTPARRRPVVFALLAALVVGLACFLVIQLRRSHAPHPYDRNLTRAFIKAAGFADYFDLERAGYLAELDKNLPGLAPDQAKKFGESLNYQAFEWSFAGRVESYLSIDDLKRTTTFLTTGAGRKKAEFSKKLMDRAVAENLSSDEIEAATEEFQNGLSADEHRELDAFYDSAVGRRYNTANESLLEFFGNSFMVVVEDARLKVTPKTAEPWGLKLPPDKTPALPPAPGESPAFDPK
jgi:hypothetical protein